MSEHYPTHITWEINSECNYRCIYCYNFNHRQNTTESDFDKNLKYTSSFIVSQRPTSVTISGGEPLMLFPMLKSYIVNLLRNKIRVRIFTNGSFITEEIADFCAQNNISLMVSFPSADSKVFAVITGCKHSYDSTIAGLHILQRYGVTFQPNIVVTTLNIETLADTIVFLHTNFSPAGIFVSRATKPSNATDDFAELLLNNTQLEQMFNVCVEFADKYNIAIKSCGGFPLCIFKSQKAYDIFGKVCGAGERDCVITSSGDVRVCTRDDSVYGNIFKEPFEQITDRMKVWRQYELPQQCSACNRKKSCRGGCHMSSTEQNRNPGSLDYNAEPSNVPIYFKHKIKRMSVKEILLCLKVLFLKH